MIPNLDDYMLAPSGQGPLASAWIDKPHRLIYDLVHELRRMRELWHHELAYQDKTLICYTTHTEELRQKLK